MPSNWIFWVLFNVFVLAMLALDLGVFHRKKHVVGFREAMGWTVVWITLAAVLCRADLLLRAHNGGGKRSRRISEFSLEFITGYLIEVSLSVDNLFIFLVIFRYFAFRGVSARGVVLGRGGCAGDARCISSWPE